jgi:hypothetical protein
MLNPERFCTHETWIIISEWTISLLRFYWVWFWWWEKGKTSKDILIILVSHRRGLLVRLDKKGQVWQASRLGCGCVMNKVITFAKQLMKRHANPRNKMLSKQTDYNRFVPLSHSVTISFNSLWPPGHSLPDLTPEVRIFTLAGFLGGSCAHPCFKALHRAGDVAQG